MAAVNSLDNERWFFTPNDDVLLPHENKSFSRSVSGAGSVSNGFSPVGSSWSGLSSPLGSELGSTETESEEDGDEFMAELTRQMANYMLQEDDEEGGVEEYCGPKKIALNKEKNPKPTENQFKKFKQGLAKGTESTQQPERKKPNRTQNIGAGVLGAPPAVWPPLKPPQQVKYGSGMRAVFLGGPASETRTSGTGVFLPRGGSNPPETRKKFGCSTVLIPDRVLNALQLHFQNMKNRSQSNGPAGLKSYPPQYDITPAQTRQRLQSQNNTTNTISDTGLPQEWTY